MKAYLAFAAAAGALAAPAAAQAPADWTKTVIRTAEGGFRVGNPNARVKLVEYASLTCPHCAQFSAAATQPLMANYVRKGRVSFEFRNYLLNGTDISASMIAHCAGPSKFFPLTKAMFATQNVWTGKVAALPAADHERLQALPPSQAATEIAQVAGLFGIARQHGVTDAQAKRCLADAALRERLLKMRQAASAAGVQGTPTFYLNGGKIGARRWPQVESAIRRALGERG